MSRLEDVSHFHSRTKTDLVFLINQLLRTFSAEYFETDDFIQYRC